MNTLTIVTHNGNFHADDVFSIASLQIIFNKINLIRTRDKTLISDADIVIDVGGEYDADNGRFDHHQRGGAGNRENGIPYSSFGLVWQKYGQTICGGDQAVADIVDTKLVSVIDAVDCGYKQGLPTGISLSQTIGMMNPTWQESADFDACFNEAVSFATNILKRFIASAKGSIDAKNIVAKAIADAKDPRVIILNQYAPWKSTVHELSQHALYVIYPSETDQWRIQTVPLEPGSFDDRHPLPAQWAGLSDGELQAVTGIDDATFCHNGCFIAGADSFESTVKMAELALNN